MASVSALKKQGGWVGGWGDSQLYHNIHTDGVFSSQQMIGVLSVVLF